MKLSRSQFWFNLTIELLKFTLVFIAIVTIGVTILWWSSKLRKTEDRAPRKPMETTLWVGNNPAIVEGVRYDQAIFPHKDYDFESEAKKADYTWVSIGYTYNFLESDRALQLYYASKNSPTMVCHDINLETPKHYIYSKAKIRQNKLVIFWEPKEETYPSDWLTILGGFIIFFSVMWTMVGYSCFKRVLTA